MVEEKTEFSVVEEANQIQEKINSLKQRIDEYQENQSKWDNRFLDMARLVASWSKDPSTKCGAVITQGKRIVSCGFNGFPSSDPDRPEDYNNREVKYQKVVHCELNAILFADRKDLIGATLYTWPFGSCDRCAPHVVQAGIKRCVAPINDNPRWNDSLKRAADHFKDNKVELVLLKRDDI